MKVENDAKIYDIIKKVPRMLLF